MASLAEIRQQYPQYNDLSDEALADAFHKKFYSDMPREDFNTKLGIEPSWGETFATAKQNLPSPVEFLKSQLNPIGPIEDVKHLGKVVLGGAENAINAVKGGQNFDQYSNEQQVASDFGKHYTNYLSEKGIKENVSQDPVGTLTDALSLGIPAARAGTQSALNVGRRAITPFPARQGFVEAADTLANEGVQTTAGQRTGNRGLKYAESTLGGGKTSTILDNQLEQYTRAASHRIGEDTPSLDTKTINAAGNRIGNDFNQVGLRNNIPPDPQVAIDLQRAVQEYKNSVPLAAPGIENMATAISNRSANGISGNTYNAFRSRLSRQMRNTNDPQMKAAYGDMREALDDAMERRLTSTGNKADLKAFATARKQYRNWIVLRDAMATGGEDTARGLLTPTRLEQTAAAGPNRSWYARGLSDFSDLAKAGKADLGKMPESGSAARIGINAVPAAIGGAIGAGTMGGLGAAAGAVGGRYAAGRALMSRPVQAYLGNQLLPNNAQLGGTGFTRTSPVTATVSDRKRALKQAEKVLSPEVLDQVKRFASKEMNAWLSSPSPQTTKALASVIAQKANRPDLLDRLVNELGQ